MEDVCYNCGKPIYYEPDEFIWRHKDAGFIPCQSMTGPPRAVPSSMIVPLSKY